MDKKLIDYSKSLKNFIDMSSGDPTAIIAKEHGIMGLTRLIICMDKLGLNTDNLFFIALPDYTYTRNVFRWNAGFPYGCIICTDQTEPFIPIDFRPNCCGIVFAEIPEEDFDLIKLKNTYHSLLHSYSDLDPTDFNRRNHFFCIYRNEKTDKFYFLIHGSFMFAKNGLYSEKNQGLIAQKKTMDILGTPFNYLCGYEAIQYYNNYLHHEKLSNFYRELILKTLFPEAKILFHRTHEGFMDIGTLLLGAYADYNPFSCPIMLSPDENLPYVSINNPVELGDSKKLYCAPHGGGYALSSVVDAKKNEMIENEFIITYTNNSKMLTNNIIDMPFSYRNDSADKWCSLYKKGNVTETLKPLYNLKV